MKICLLSNSDGRGGAYAAAYRLHQSLGQIGLESILLVNEKTRDNSTVVAPTDKLAKAWTKLLPMIEQLPLALYSQRERTPYSLQWLPDWIASKVARIAPDIINLHWINGGFLHIETLAQFQKPLIWTIHDMWPFTGGCHYSGDCDNYTRSCGTCPQLHSDRGWDISHWVWRRKANLWDKLNLTLVSPSQWLADCARRSSLGQNLRVEVIPNGLDIQKYRPIDKKLARDLLGLPLDKKIVLFGAISPTGDRRKGFHLLLPALQKLSQQVIWPDKLELVIFGGDQSLNSPNFGLKTHYLGRLGDDISLALVYASADVFVAPSIQDNLPNTVMEALSCGTPCVAFQIGGMPDMIEQGENGYLAAPFAIEDLANGIAWVLEDEERYQKLRNRSRQKVTQEFTLELQASRYLALYHDLIDRRIDVSTPRDNMV